MVPQIVPHPLPLSSPPISLDFNERRFWAVVMEAAMPPGMTCATCGSEWEGKSALDAIERREALFQHVRLSVEGVNGYFSSDTGTVKVAVFTTPLRWN